MVIEAPKLIAPRKRFRERPMRVQDSVPALTLGQVSGVFDRAGTGL